MEEFIKTLLLTGKMAVITTAILFIFSLPVSYWLAYSKFKGKVLFEALLCMPMVLPPTVLGYYFLLLISPTRGLGKYLSETFDIQLAFTFEGIMIASIGRVLAGLVGHRRVFWQPQRDRKSVV